MSAIDRRRGPTLCRSRGFLGSAGGAVVMLCLLLFGAGFANANDGFEKLAAGSGSFQFEDRDENLGKPIIVWFHKPTGASPDGPVVFVMHGTQRNGEEYRDQWVAKAKARNFLLIVPEFDDDYFPGSWRYQMGNAFRAAGGRKKESRWVFTLIELIFDALRRDFGVRAAEYDIYGHGAGAQLVHRFVLFKPKTRIRTAIAANAGWYTMVDAGVDIPYGIANAEMTDAQLRQAFATRLIVFLGTADNDPNHYRLRRSARAMRQGRHRLARGERFFRMAKEEAGKLGVPFRWTLKHAPGVAHDNTQMVEFAADHLAVRR